MKTALMKLFTCLALGLVLTLPGCARKKAPTPAADSSPDTFPAAPAAKRASRPTEAKANVDQNVGVVDAAMTKQLRIFLREAGRMPENFSELANARMDSVPRAPEGMKWVIDPVTVEVKLARK